MPHAIPPGLPETGVVSLTELPPPRLHKDKWDGVCMVILR
jgi:hypothetical protein